MSCTTVTESPPRSALDDMPSSDDGSHRHSYGTSHGRVICGSEKIQNPCTQESISQLIKVLEKDAKNLKAVSEFVQKHSGELIKFVNSYLYLCDLHGTIYMGQKYMHEGWEELYLPEITRMEVFGTLEMDSVDIFPCPSEQWVILVGEDGYVYAYWNEELKLIAKSLREFVKNGMREAYKTYPYPEPSHEDKGSPQPSEEILKIRQRTRDFVNSQADEFKKFLDKMESLKRKEPEEVPSVCT